MRVLLDLTSEQEKTFRPLQKAYDKELKTLDKKDRKLIREFAGVYDNLTAETATDLAKRFFDLRRERLALQEKYLKQMSDEVSPATAVLLRPVSLATYIAESARCNRVLLASASAMSGVRCRRRVATPIEQVIPRRWSGSG